MRAEYHGGGLVVKILGCGCKWALEGQSSSSIPQYAHLKTAIFTELFESYEMVYPKHVLQCLVHSSCLISSHSLSPHLFFLELFPSSPTS